MSDIMCLDHKSTHTHKSNNRRRAITSIIDEGGRENPQWLMFTRKKNMI